MPPPVAPKYGMQTSEQDMDAEELESVLRSTHTGKKGAICYYMSPQELIPAGIGEAYWGSEPLLQMYT